MNRFAVGEITIVLPSAKQGTDSPMECEVMAVPSGREEFMFGGMKAPHTYLIKVPGFHCGVGQGYFQVRERDLRKRPQRGIPDAVRALFDVPRKVGEPA